VNIFKTSPFSHLMAMQRCLQKYQADATLDPLDFTLQVRARNRYYTLYPMFLGAQAGRLHYTRQVDESTIGFAGWMPYFNKRWPIGSGKFAFKDYCQRNGLRTPAMWRSPAPDMGDFLVKHDNKSFGQAIHGPFRRYDARDSRQAIDDKGYYEAFIRGRIVKATYWESRLAAVEIKTMATVKGDGKSKLRQLIEPLMHAETPADEWDNLAAIAAAYEDLTLDAVPAAGRSVLVDFRFASYANAIDRNALNPYADLAGTPLLKQLVECGPVLWAGVPESLRAATLFTVDAMADEQDRLWLLEMNCNPVCHPRVYPLMFETLFGPADTQEEAAQVPASALPHPSLAIAATARSAALMGAPAGIPATIPMAGSHPFQVS
jgi:hypothetical protein